MVGQKFSLLEDEGEDQEEAGSEEERGDLQGDSQAEVRLDWVPRLLHPGLGVLREGWDHSAS